MSWRTGSKLFIEMWPLIQANIPDKQERIEFTGELLQLFAKWDVDTWELEDANTTMTPNKRDGGDGGTARQRRAGRSCPAAPHHDRLVATGMSQPSTKASLLPWMCSFIIVAPVLYLLSFGPYFRYICTGPVNAFYWPAYRLSFTPPLEGPFTTYMHWWGVETAGTH